MNAHRRLLTTAAAAIALGAAAAPASAAPVAYQGSTSAGEVLFERDGDTISNLNGYVGAACASSRTADTKAGADVFYLEQPFALGEEVEQTYKHNTMLGWSSTADKTYRATLTPNADGTISGKVVVSFMLFEPYYNAWGHLDANTFVCQGEGTFTAAPVEEPEAEQAVEPKGKKQKKAKQGKRAKRGHHARG